MALTGKQTSSTLATSESFPTAEAWRQGLRWRRWRKFFPMVCGILLAPIMILCRRPGPMVCTL